MKKLVLVVMLAGFGSLAATAQEKATKAKASEKPAVEAKEQEKPGKPAAKGEVSPNASPNATKAREAAPGRSKKAAAPAKISVNEEGLPAEKGQPAKND